MNCAPRRVPTLLVVALALFTVGCLSGSEQPSGPDRPVVDLTASLDQSLVLHSSVLRFALAGADGRGVTGAIVRFEGAVEEGRGIAEAYRVDAPSTVDGGGVYVDLPVAEGLWQAVDPAPEASFEGSVQVELVDELGPHARATLDGVRLRFVDRLAPQIETIASGAYHVGQRLKLSGAGFLRPEEGETWLVVDAGTISYPGGARRRIVGARVALEWSGSRDEAQLPISPALFGVREGHFEGQLRFVNELATGERFEGEGRLSAELELRGPRIAAFEPTSASRGQKVRLRGRGFLPDDPATDSGMYLLFEGALTPASGGEEIDYGEDRAVTRVPARVLDERTLELEVWYEVDEALRRLSGLGATPGIFRGSVTPVSFDASAEQAGPPYDLRFQVLPTRQVVFLKYLPGFAEALSRYGLANVEADIRARARAVLERDYAEVNVVFVDQPPEDFAEYTTIEIGGADPSGLGQFGYDNSFNDGGKDVGNLYLSDYLGGVNRRSEEAGYLPYGGVFIGSFRAFSPTLFPDALGTAAAFDQLMAPFMPELGGEAVRGTEWPDGPRHDEIAAAIAMMGNLTGHTASHELGHALGLAHFPASVEGWDERFHNDPPGPGFIMDDGGARPFAERAGLDGAPASRFSPQNLDYLREILPKGE